MTKIMTGARLRYVMDPMCSWCWGFAPVVDALASRAATSGVVLELVAGGLRPGKGAALTVAERDYILEYWRQISQYTGQPFRFEQALPSGFVYDTEPACRALVTARQLDAGSVWPLIKRLQHAFYVECRDITQPSVLVELAETEGFSRNAFAERFDHADTRQAVSDDFAWVQALGIAGFPTLLAERNGQLALLTNGYQPLETLSALLDRWLSRGQTER